MTDSSRVLRGTIWTDSGYTIITLNISADYVSADGQVVAGITANFRAYRWTAQTGVQLLTSATSEVGGMLLDGNIIVGAYEYAPNAFRVFRWSTAEGFQVPAQFLAYQWSTAYCLSGDGNYIFGQGDRQNGTVYFRWGEGPPTPMFFGPVSTTYRGDTAIGTVVGIWNEQDGYWDLTALYPHLFADGSTIEALSQISPDGRFIVGTGFHASTRRREAFLIRRGCALDADINKGGVVDDADLLTVLFDFGRSCSR